MPIPFSGSEVPPQQQSFQVPSSFASPLQCQQRRNSATLSNMLSILEIRQAMPGYFAEHSSMVPQRMVRLEPVLPILPEWSSDYSPKMVSRTGFPTNLGYCLVCIFRI